MFSLNIGSQLTLCDKNYSDKSLWKQCGFNIARSSTCNRMSILYGWPYLFSFLNRKSRHDGLRGGYPHSSLTNCDDEWNFGPTYGRKCRSGNWCICKRYWPYNYISWKQHRHIHHKFRKWRKKRGTYLISCGRECLFYRQRTISGRFGGRFGYAPSLHGRKSIKQL